VKQGGKASPFKFNIYIDKLIKILIESGTFFKLRTRSKSVLAYADDTTIVFKTIEELGYAISMIENYCDLFDIKINEKKT